MSPALGGSDGPVAGEVAAAYGSWPSPITAESIAAGGVGLGGPAVRGAERWWSESRPTEAGRVVLVRSVDGGPALDMLPPGFSARTRVHEYGGGAWFLGRHHTYFSNMGDQRLYRLDADGGDPVAITPEPPFPGAWRYADGVEVADGGWIVCVRESHVAPDDSAADREPAEVTPLAEARNEIVVFPTDGSLPPRVEVTGSDFVAAPRVSADGRWVSWIAWDHPNMPWDGTRLCAAPIFDRCRFGNRQVVAGNDHESILGANWSADGRLIFATDRSGYWNLHRWRPGDLDDHPLTRTDEGEIGHPPWVFGTQPWVEASDGRIFVVLTRQAVDLLGLVEADGGITVIDERFAAIDGLAVTDDDHLVCIVAPVDTPPAVVTIDPTDGATTVLRPPTAVVDDPGWIARAERFTFNVGPSEDGTGGDGGDRHAFFYPPTAPGMTGPAGTRPPLIVVGHGGPTAHATPALNTKIQYWTSRGFAVVDVNYGGSTGFGRAYRRLLNGSWGVGDVADCIAAAQALAAAGRVDAGRMAIRGSSAGGLTVLNALITSDVFAAGTSLYGVADLAALATDTHKFERRYLDNLVGPWPEAAEVYRQRSPIEHVAGLSCPLLVLQGTEDEIVPPSQAEAIVAAVAAKGIPHAVLYFEGEQHGFRQRESIVRSLEAELWFYGRVFGFTPADAIDPIEGAVGL